MTSANNIANNIIMSLKSIDMSTHIMIPARISRVVHFKLDILNSHTIARYGENRSVIYIN